ncbi:MULTISPECIES: DnaB-like helicase C-terminal domain-containing protein [Hyphobacterium]|uniref:DNA 5'-3' helicase n=1 Tax=Hyphobacterium vulgare TaxID=1736751 RepID=A0ABV6ZUA1_9PROT
MMELEEETARKNPHNLDAEQAFLGALFYDNSLLEQVSAWLKPEHFYDPVHGRIYERAVDMITHGQLADSVTLKQSFEADDGIAEIGGTRYLAVLLEAAADSAAAVEYARMVQDLSVRRALLKLSRDITASAERSWTAMPTTELVERAETELVELARGGIEHEKRVSSLYGAAGRVLSDVSGETRTAAVTTGISDLDRALAGGLRRSKLYIVAGRPGMAKTVLGLAIQHGGASAGFFSPMVQNEMDADEVAERYMSMLAATDTELSSFDRITYEDIARWRTGESDEPNRAQRAAMERARERMRDLPMPIIDGAGMTVPGIRSRLRRMYRDAERDGFQPGPLIIDYLQLIEAHTQRGNSLTAEVTDIANGLKQLAKELKVPVVALSQLSRACEQRQDKRPHLGDLRESGAIEQNADAVLMLYREAYYAEQEEAPVGVDAAAEWADRCNDRTLEVLIRKLRGGKTGVVRLHADVARNLVTNKAADWVEQGRAA